DCLARADLALQQAVHRMVPRDLGRDLLSYPPLPVGQGERESGVELGERAVHSAAAWNCWCAAGPVPAPGELGLHDEGLVEPKAVAGLFVLSVVTRLVDGADGGTERQQVAVDANLLWQEVGQHLGRVEHHSDAVRDVPAPDLRGGRVDRDQRTGE